MDPVLYRTPELTGETISYDSLVCGTDTLLAILAISGFDVDSLTTSLLPTMMISCLFSTS
jgi:hypothetical protein